jgi:glucose/arabinose dehydrogenase
MAFDVYPNPQTTPLNVARAVMTTVLVPGLSPLIPIDERVSVNPMTMFIRVIKLGTGCAASGPPHPTIRLQADTGDAVDIPIDSTIVAIFNLPGGPGGEGLQVANVGLVSVEVGDMYLIRISVFHPGSSWKIQIANNDPASAHDFTWVVADNETQTRQPWIDAPTTLGFEVFAGQIKQQDFRIVNRGTGPLEIKDHNGADLGARFVLTTVPNVIHPNSCADAQITFTSPDTPGTNETRYTVDSSDTTAQLAPGHNRSINLSATTQRGLPPGTILITGLTAPFGPGVLIRVDPVTRAQTTVSSGGVFHDPFGVAVEADGKILVADPPTVDKQGEVIAPGGVIRVDPDSGAQTTVFSGGALVRPRGIAVEADGKILVADAGPRGGLGGVIRVDPVTQAQTTVFSGGALVRPFGVAVEADGKILILDHHAFGGLGGVIRVDPVTQAQTTVFSGGAFVKPRGIAVEADGKILVADAGAFGGLGGVIRIDPVTQAQTTVFSGGALMTPFGVAVEADGNILVAFGGSGGVIRINSVTQAQTPVSSSGALVTGAGVAVVPKRAPAVVEDIPITTGDDTPGTEPGVPGNDADPTSIP